MSDERFLDGYDAVEVELNDGTILRAEPLTTSEFARFWRLYNRAAGLGKGTAVPQGGNVDDADLGPGDPEAFMELLDEFPEAIGRPDLRDELTPAEVFALVPAFFPLARTGKLPKGGQKTGAEKTDPDPASTTSSPTTPPDTEDRQPASSPGR